MVQYKLQNPETSFEEIKGTLEQELGGKYKVYEANKLRNLGTGGALVGGKTLFIKRNAYHGISVLYQQSKGNPHLTIDYCTPSTGLSLVTQRMGFLAIGILRLIFGGAGTMLEEVQEVLQKAYPPAG